MRITRGRGFDSVSFELVVTYSESITRGRGFDSGSGNTTYEWVDGITRGRGFDSGRADYDLLPSSRYYPRTRV